MNCELKIKRDDVNKILDSLLAELDDVQPDLRKAIAYTLQAPGKRIRSALVLICCEIVSDQTNKAAQAAAAAIEMVHTYSLVHDDLPAMDNDDLRRGRPTCHKAFDEATAILTGDALLTMAFELLAKKVDQPDIATKLIIELAAAAGPAGMIAGQIADLKAENSQPDKAMLEYIHINKTAKMFQAAAAMGAIAGNANPNQLESLRQYGLKIGLGFQIADDILDVCATSDQLGKTAGKDIKAGKLTYPALIGLERSKQLEKQLANQAIEAINQFNKKATPLRELATALLERKS